MNRQELAQHLYGLADGTIQPKYREFGICKELIFLSARHGMRDGLAAESMGLMREWPRYSGFPNYPVPYVGLSPRRAYLLKNLWDNDEYGDNRRDLCRFIADKLMEPVGQ